MYKKILPYMSFWSCNSEHTSEFIINLHKLAAFLLKENFGEVHFITDSKGLELFKNIPWSSVSLELNNIDKNYYQVWSLGKIYSFKEIASKKQPFIHVDYDVLLWNKPCENFLNSNLFAQNSECTIKQDYEIDKFKINCPSLHIINNNFPDNAPNLGIFGGHDTDFIYTYAQEAINFVLDPINKNFWQNYNQFKNKDWTKAVIAEQYFLSIMTQKYNKSITYLFNEWPTEETAAKKKYTHLMGAKKNPGIKKIVSDLVLQIGL
jgi:hypothetical protein